MKKPFLEAGKIVNTHGVRGEVKIQAWCDSAEFLSSFSTLYIDGTPIKILNARPQKDCVLATLEGVNTVDDAVRLKNKIVFIARSDAKLPPDTNFIQDLIGLDAIDSDTGKPLGRIANVISLPSGNVYEIAGDREILVPDVPEFVRETDLDGGYIKFHLIEGM